MKSNSNNPFINNPEHNKSHVVLLGAGASKASFPNGDANEKKVPVMNDLADVLNLTIPPRFNRHSNLSSRCFIIF